MTGRALAIAGVVLGAAVLGLALLVARPWRGSPALPATPAAIGAAPAAASGRKIKARLFYVAEDGAHLTRVERDIAYGEGTLEQAREIVVAQLAPIGEPLVSAIPAGTALRALFITDTGDAYVDLTREIVAGHSGGTTDELMTVYTVVNALTDNLPAITAVQLLVDGKEADTLAGHVDLRNPLVKNLEWVQ